MTSSKEQETKRSLKLSRPGRLELRKTVETGQVRQSFSHGRSKTVMVEVKRKRTFAPGDGGRMTEVKGREADDQGFGDAHSLIMDAGELGRAEVRNLTAGERATRMRALEVARQEEARRRTEDELRIIEEAEARRTEEAAGERATEEEEAGRVAQEETRPPLDEVTQYGLQQEIQRQIDKPPMPQGVPSTDTIVEQQEVGARERVVETEEETPGRAKRKGVPAKPAVGRRTAEPRRRHGKLTIAQALESDGEEGRVRSLAAMRRHRERERLRAQQEQQAHQPPQRVIRDVVVPETIAVQELANRMAERGADVVKALMKMGVMATINQVIDADTAELIVGEFGHRSKRVSAADVEVGLKGTPDVDTDLVARPPVVTVMGHVDHGKTSLLDALRETDVVAHEAGGITQHIGAYQVALSSGDRITFIDTPGHAAFTEMRSRGANVTDIVVLVVAADDGVMEQTVEAISHAKAAQVPIIVAINKIDRPDSNPERVKQELLKHDLVVEQLGGDVLCVEVSAHEKTNLDKLAEAILLQSEILELKANPRRSAEGVVIEAKLERGRGSVATVLVQRGTLRVGDIFVAGTEWGRVRALMNDRGEKVDEAGPAVPVEVLGLNGTPQAGDDLIVVEHEGRAREVASFRRGQKRETEIAAQGRGTLEQMLTRIKEGVVQELPIVVKSDVHGSLEAIVNSVGQLGNKEVMVRVLHSGVGGINESDVTLARATGAIIIGFNVRANPQAREMARRDSVDIRYYSIIYNVVDDMKAAVAGLLAPHTREKLLGYAQIREVFSISKVGKVAGCMVTEGMVRRGAKVRLLRDDVVIHDGALKTLRRFKDEVKEVREGYECGMAFENYQDIQIGDQIECYEIEEIARAL